MAPVRAEIKIRHFQHSNFEIFEEIAFSFIPYTLYRPSPGINRAPIARMKMILIPIESLYKNLQF